MIPEYDFKEEEIGQDVPIVSIPILMPSMYSSRQQPMQNPFHRKSTLLNLEHFIMDEKEQQKLKIQKLKARQSHIGQDVAKQLAHRDCKLKKIQEQQKQKMNKQCTFHPKLYDQQKKIGVNKKVNFNEFLDKQKKFSKKVAQKRNTLKQSLQKKYEKQINHQPKINHTNNSKRNQNIPIYERLYALKQKQNHQNSENKKKEQDMFHPKITQKSKRIQRKTNIQDLLYGDALRRQEKNKEIQENVTQYNSKYQKNINYRNEKYAAQKFIKQYFFTLEDLSINTSVNHSIDYLEFNEILVRLGFVSPEDQFEGLSSINERKLVHDAYQYISKKQINARNICVFLLILVGIYHINPVNFQQGQQSHPQYQLNLQEIQAKKIQKKFDLLFRNRLSSDSHFKKQQQEIPEIQQKYTFKPTINKQSIQMAQKYRQQMLERANQLLQRYPQLQQSIPKDGIISHTDLLVLQKLAQEIQWADKKQIQEKNNLEKCTFKPITLYSLQNSLNNSNISNSKCHLGAKKSLQLYNYHKNKKSKKQSLQSSRQIEEEQQCTFAPKINKQRIQINQNQTQQIHGQVNQTLYRMHKGRQQHQLRLKMLQRGQNTYKQELKVNQISRLLASSSFQQNYETPTLILDVNLGQKIDRIIIYPQNQNKLEQIASIFAQKNNLDNENQIKLLNLLQIQLNNVLCKIDQNQQNNF